MTLAERLRGALDGTPPIGPLDEFPKRTIERSASAVLVPITDRADPGVLLTVRHANLRKHPGQVALPGGRADPDDNDAIDTALREAFEEIGLPPDRVEIVGTVDRYLTRTGFDITPVIGVIPPDLALMPHEVEVADIFEVPLRFLLAAANHVQRTVDHEGQPRSYYEIGWDDRRIWGVTAGILVRLSRRLATFA